MGTVQRAQRIIAEKLAARPAAKPAAPPGRKTPGGDVGREWLSGLFAFVVHPFAFVSE
jgi:hypothetical protein